MPQIEAVNSDLRNVTQKKEHPQFCLVRSLALVMEAQMTRFHEKAQALTKEAIGQMIGDDRLVSEGKEQEARAEKKQPAVDQRAKSERRE
jgi:uncharacterized protein YjbJ (UPF0337 family)